MKWLFGLGESAGGEVQDWSLRWTGAETSIQKAVLALAALAIIALIVHFYRREPAYIKRRKKIFLGVMRFLGCSVLLVILAGPVLEAVKSDVVKSTLVLMIDQSDSMNFDDRRTTQEELAEAAKAAGLDAERDREKLARIKRIDLAKAVLANPSLSLLASLEERFQLATYGFDAGSRPLTLAGRDSPGGPAGAVEAAGAVTNIGGSLREVAKQMKGRHVAGVVMLTDGGSNKGEDPLITSEELGVPVYPVGIGLPEAKDIQISYIFAEDVVFVEDRAPVYIRIRNRGYEGHKAELKLLRRPQGAKEGGEPAVEPKEIVLSEHGEQTETLYINPTQTGIYTFAARIDPRPEELVAENNEMSKDIRIIDEKIKVLLIEGDPRWEFRYLQTALKRDKRIEVKTLQRSADPEVVMPGSHYLKSFPSSREEFFKFDLVILGNVSQDYFTQSDLQMIYDFVEREGGAVLFLAGRNKMPDSYDEVTFRPEGSEVDVRFLDLLPVNVERQSAVTAADQMAGPLRPFKLQLTPEGRIHTITRFDIDTDVNAEKWSQAPELCWFYPAVSLKPLASALIVHDTERSRTGEPIPIVAVQRFGRGRTLFVGTDELWTWRWKPGPEAHERFWGQAVQFLAMAHLLGESKRIQLTTDKETYGVGDKVSITARVLDPSYSPLAAESVTATVQAGEAESHNVTLANVPGTPGMYRGEFLPQSPVTHRVTMKNADEEAEADFSVVVPRIEFDNPGMRWDLLKQIGDRSGGEARRVDGLEGLAKLIDQKREKALIKLEDSIWDAPIMVILFTLFFGIEWFVRKRSDLC